MKKFQCRQQLSHGQVIPIVALMFTFIVGLTGLVVDIGTAFNNQRIQQNAAQAAVHAATDYWAANLPTATDEQINCIVQLYASSANYPTTCPHLAPGAVPDNFGQNVSAAYIDFSGNDIGAGIAVGSLGIAKPTDIYPTAVGMRVITSGPSTAYFSKIFGFANYTVRSQAAERMGQAVSADNPGGSSRPIWNSGPSVLIGNLLPIALQSSTYAGSSKYQLSAINVSPPQNFVNSSGDCSTTDQQGFCWSTLQCPTDTGNVEAAAWLTMSANPCLGQSTLINTQASPLCNPVPSPQVICNINVVSGPRASNLGDIQASWAGKIAIVPIVTTNGPGAYPIAQFAYLYISGTAANSIQGYFLDPATMPPLNAVTVAGCAAGSEFPCGITGF